MRNFRHNSPPDRVEEPLLAHRQGPPRSLHPTHPHQEVQAPPEVQAHQRAKEEGLLMHEEVQKDHHLSLPLRYDEGIRGRVKLMDDFYS